MFEEFCVDKLLNRWTATDEACGSRIISSKRLSKVRSLKCFMRTPPNVYAKNQAKSKWRQKKVTAFSHRPLSGELYFSTLIASDGLTI